MSNRIAPALTPEAWAEATEDATYFKDMVEEAADDLAADLAAELPVREFATRHALAALALHGQPFGFTREDVTLLNEVIDEEPGALRVVGAEVEKLRSLAARIEALLPPEDR